MFLYLQYPSWIHPEIFPSIPWLSMIRWYGLMYVFAFTTAYFILKKVSKEGALDTPNYKVTEDDLFSFIATGILFLLLGARIGSTLIYNTYDPTDPYSINYWTHPWLIFWPFDRNMHYTGFAGMSYHGGLILGTIFGIIGMKKNKIDVWKGLNLCFLAVPLAYTWGRWGNFINGELFGEVTTSSIGMYFPLAHDSPLSNPILHHPSQLYEMLFEGVILFAILYNLRRIPKLRDKMPCLYLMGYGIFRFFIEFFRKSDAHLGRNDLFGMSRGQTLCSLMILAGVIWLVVMFYREKKRIK